MQIKDLIAEMEAGLEGVTPGEWTTQSMQQRISPTYRDKYEYLGVFGESTVLEGLDGIAIPDRMNDRQFIEDAANMRHIARCGPANIRALLDHIAGLEAERDEAVEALEPFARLSDNAHGKSRYFIQLLICPEGDVPVGDVKDFAPDIRHARRIRAALNKDNSHG